METEEPVEPVEPVEPPVEEPPAEEPPVEEPPAEEPPVEEPPVEPVVTEPTPLEGTTSTEPIEQGYLVDWVHTFLGDAPFGLEWFPFVIGGVILMFLMEFVFDFFRDIGKAFWR